MMYVTKRKLQNPRITTSYYLTDSWPLKIISVENIGEIGKGHHLLWGKQSGVTLKKK